LPIFDENQILILNSVKKMAKEKIAPLADTIDREGVFRWDVARLLAEIGLFQIYLPPEHGGLDKDCCLMFCLCTEEVARACASSALSIIIQAVGSYPIVEFGSTEQKERLFPRLSTGRELVAYLVSEPDAGSDVASIRTKGTRKGDNYVLSGNKVFATNGGVASLATVLCRTGEEGYSFFVIEMDSKGIILGKQEEKLGFRGSNTQGIVLDKVVVPSGNLLGKEGDGFKIAMKDFDMSRPGVAALALGIAESALDVAIEYASQRHAFGKPLAKHQAIEFMIADASTDIEAGKGLMIKAAQLRDKGERNTKFASMAKYFCSDAAMKITTNAIQILGGYGYCKEYQVERMFRDAKLTQIFEGTNQIQRIIVGREVLREKGNSM
jgi:cyclohexane-1-carbonyl-CoA dehydrogenase